MGMTATTVLETAFSNQDGTKGTDPYLSVTSRSTLPPNPYPPLNPSRRPLTESV
jgi:hypothetical protein